MEKCKPGSTGLSSANISQLHPSPLPIIASQEEEQSQNGAWSHQNGELHFYSPLDPRADRSAGALMPGPGRCWFPRGCTLPPSCMQPGYVIDGDPQLGKVWDPAGVLQPCLGFVSFQAHQGWVSGRVGRSSMEKDEWEKGMVICQSGPFI